MFSAKQIFRLSMLDGLCRNYGRIFALSSAAVAPWQPLTSHKGTNVAVCQLNFTYRHLNLIIFKCHAIFFWIFFNNLKMFADRTKQVVGLGVSLACHLPSSALEKGLRTSWSPRFTLKRFISK